MLSEEKKAFLVDLRAKNDIMETGSPDLRSIKKKPILIPYQQVCSSLYLANCK